VWYLTTPVGLRLCRRYAVGLRPVSFRNARDKWWALAKPVCSATSATVSAVEIFSAAGSETTAEEPKDSAPRLGVKGTTFTLNGEPMFLLGISYYGGLGASEETIPEGDRDVDLRVQTAPKDFQHTFARALQDPRILDRIPV
jgi:hypothetical protein